jgi:hypothetical protein
MEATVTTETERGKRSSGWHRWVSAPVGWLCRRVRGTGRSTDVFEVFRPEQIVLDVVFVHGLDGDARRTWTGEDHTFWPGWLAEDVPGVAVWDGRL